MRELWFDSPYKISIHVGSHCLDGPVNVRNAWHEDETSGRSDGVHYNSEAGKAVYLNSIINILLTSFNIKGAARDARRSNARDEQDHTTCPQALYKRDMAGDKQDHTNCPQAVYMRENTKERRQYSHVVAGQHPIKTSNRFSALNNISEN